MATEATPRTIELESEEDLQQFLSEIRQQKESGRFTVDIPVQSDVLATNNEMRELVALCRSKNIELSLRTDDPVRIELARIAGLEIEPQHIGEKQFASASITRKQLLVKQSQPNAGLHDAKTVVGAEIAGTQPEIETPEPESTNTLEAMEWSQFPTESQPSFSFVITPPTKSRSLPEAATTSPEQIRNPHPTSSTRKRQRRSSVGVLSTITLIGTIVGVAVILIGFFAPYANVSLTPVTTPVETELVYGVAGSAESLGVALEPEILSTTLSWEGSMPTTGERFVPDATASGEIIFTNPSTSAVIVPAGTVLQSDDGIEYRTSEEVIVPAADPFGSRMFGSGQVEIVAAIPGPEGNQAAQAITGNLDNGLFFQNQLAIDGGTMRRIQVVGEQDVESLRSTAQSEFELKAAGEAASQLTGDQVIIADSQAIGPVSFTLSAEPGIDAETLSMSATAPLTFAVYSPEELHQLARTEIQNLVSNAQTDNEQLDPESIWMSDPEQLEEGQGLVFKILAGGNLIAILDQAELDSLKSNLLGANETEAIELASQVNGVAESSVSYGPDWFPVWREPRLESRIFIEIIN